MLPVQQRVVMLVDLDYFFAQCEELRNPTLKDKPVVIGMYSGRTEDSGAVSTSNYVARKYGVKSGMPLFLAKKRLEGVDSVFLPVDHDFYQQLSDKIMNILRGYADAFEQVGIDEAYLDVTQKLHGNFEEAIALIHEMKNDVKKQVGITFSVGVGPNKLVAKIASNQNKPDGITVIRPEQVNDFLAPLPVDKLLGVGRKTALKMEELGIKTIGDLATYDAQRLIEIFGRALGVYFHSAANGIDNEAVVEAGEAESISRIATLKEDTRDFEVIIQKINQLTEEIYKELDQKKLTYKQITIIAVRIDLTTRSRSLTLEKSTKGIEALRRHTRELLEKYLNESDLPVRRIGVKVAQLRKEEKKQQQLTSFLQTNKV
ncbi:MAG: DNA polymerase IV [Candidatus Bathyarchaeota archaeon]|nr:DNA polymerase IV [Candidatus Bathyarchaeota archaeon]